MIPYKEYAASKADEVKALTTSKPTVEDEENWDEELLFPPCETLPGAEPVLQSQEDQWKLMINQDPHSGSVAGDSGHRTMAVTPEDNPVDSDEKMVGTDENITIPQTPDAALTPVNTSTESKMGSSLKSPLEKKPCFWESIAVVF